MNEVIKDFAERMRINIQESDNSNTIIIDLDSIPYPQETGLNEFILILAYTESLQKCMYISNNGKKTIELSLNSQMSTETLNQITSLAKSIVQSPGTTKDNIYSQMKDKYDLIYSLSTLIYAMEKDGTIELNLENNKTTFSLEKSPSEIFDTYEEAFNESREYLIDRNISNIFYSVGDLSLIKNDSDARKAAKTFAEGKASLEELLYYCFTNGIKTELCCAGHPNGLMKKRGYISFNISDSNTNNYFNYLCQKLRITPTKDEHERYDKYREIRIHNFPKSHLRFHRSCYHGNICNAGLFSFDDEEADNFLGTLLQYAKEYTRDKDFGDR